jgi:hypothetical protein
MADQNKAPKSQESKKETVRFPRKVKSPVIVRYMRIISKGVVYGD